MTIAEIHGKTPFNNSEDLLTADVFTAFRYLPAAEGIYAFLQSIPGLGEKLPETPEGEITALFHFWPSGTLYRREPDILLALQLGQRIIHIVVEAKYLSGASDLEIQEVEKDQQTVQIGNQLADQLRDLEHGQYKIFQDGQRNDWLTLTSAPEDRYLLYLTAHIRRPEVELKRAQVYYPAAAGKLFWANWYQVFAHFLSVRQQVKQSPYPLILQDICLLLARKGFATFQGFHPLLNGQVEPSAAAFWKEPYLSEPTFAGITAPPSTFVVSFTPWIFWIGDNDG